MNIIAKPAFSPLALQNRSAIWQIGAVILGTLVLAASSYIEVPMIPVPITMQTFAITMIGALYGWRLGSITVAAWLAEGAVGMPVLAGGAAGIQHFIGPTGGYLFSFPLIAALMGWLAEKGWNGKRPVLAFTGMLLSNGLCLLIGWAWLSVIIGAEPAFIHGVLPFIIGAGVKSALGAAALGLLSKPRKS